MTKTKHIYLILVACGLMLSFKVQDSFFEISKNIEIFTNVYKELNENYVDDIQPGTVMKKGIDAMLNELDPYTNFFSENQAEKALIDRNGEYGGVGCRVKLREKQVIVWEVFPDYAFAKADVREGDILKSINGVPLYGKDMDDVSVLLRGSSNSVFELTLTREGRDMTKNINRMQVVTKSVPYYGKLNASTGYIHLSTFGREAASEISNAILVMDKDEKTTGIILDLRDNGGGLLDEAVNIIGLFVGDGKTVVNMRGKSAKNTRDWKTMMKGVALEKRLTILVNSRSASASEVVSASIQDLDRGVVLGQTSFGKGLVQNYINLPYRTQLKVTTAKYYTPSGRCVQKLDYAKRSEDGSVGAMPDSLRRIYKTAIGRKVMDGGGVTPDVPLEANGGLGIFKQLEKYWISFDFVNRYRNSHENLDKIDFLTTADLNEFINNAATILAKEMGDNYKKQMSKDFDNELFANDIWNSTGFSKSMEKKTKDLLEKNRLVLQFLLENEIIKRYHKPELEYKKLFAADPEVLKAMEVMQSTKYNDLLKP
jgi:carboxyl-terminal processing protease